MLKALLTDIDGTITDPSRRISNAAVQAIRSLVDTGIRVAVANAHPDVKKVAGYITQKEYGDGFVEAVEKYRSYFRA